MATSTPTSSGASSDLASLREDVAMANRIAHRVGLVSAFGHISARIPGTNTFLFPTRASPALARPEKLLTLDVDGSQLHGEGTPNTEFWIHARIYAARPDVGAVAHVHSESCVVVGQMGQTVRALHNTGAVVARDDLPVFPRIGLIRSRELGDQVAATLGQHGAMLLRGHGANVADSDVRRTVVKACFLEEAAKLQLQALSAVGGDPSRVTFFEEEEVGRLREQLDNPGVLNRAWEYYSSLVLGGV